MNQQRKKFLYTVVIGRAGLKPSEPLPEMKIASPSFLKNRCFTDQNIIYNVWRHNLP